MLQRLYDFSGSYSLNFKSIVDWSCMCKSNGKTMDHLFLHYDITRVIWIGHWFLFCTLVHSKRIQLLVMRLKLFAFKIPQHVDSANWFTLVFKLVRVLKLIGTSSVPRLAYAPPLHFFINEIYYLLKKKKTHMSISSLVIFVPLNWKDLTTRDLLLDTHHPPKCPSITESKK